MSAEEEECLDQAGELENLKTCAGSLQQSSAIINKIEPTSENGENLETEEATFAIPNLPTDIREEIPAQNSEQNILSTDSVTVKKEPGSDDSDMPIANTQSEQICEVASNTLNSSYEFDSDMPIANTESEQICEVESNTLNSSYEFDSDMPIAKTQSEQICEVESNRLNSNEEIQTGIQCEGNKQVDTVADKLALDAYLDGLETPIAPIRVKAEFSLPKSPQPIGDRETASFVQPTPPPSFASNFHNSDITDGIATPRISLVSINRLRVKTEFSAPPPSPPHNDNFLDDHLITETEPREAGEVSPNMSEESENETIPPDFFDDLLRDKLKEKIAQAQFNDIEEKYSDRLKELKRLKSLEEVRQKNRKKHKKHKKKGKKRSRSRSLSPNNNKERNYNDLSNLSNFDRNKRSRISPPHREMASTSNYSRIEPEDANFNCLRVDRGFKIKSEYPATSYVNTTEESEFIENDEEIEVLSTPKEKRERAIKRATALLNLLKESSADDSKKLFSKFLFVSTVRKLPTSYSYVQQQIYENRSPLHTVNNVTYKFNSHTSRFNMEEWGLAALSPQAAKMAKLVGCDAQFIHNRLKTIKIPAKLKKIKQEPNRDTENEEEEELIETTSSLFANVMTQTDDDGEFNMPRKAKGYEIGIQVEPNTYSIGSQTIETQSPTENVHKDDEAPIMKILHGLNENQLMSIHAFAELIREPKANANAMEMYKIQMQILDIYKMSQMPSSLLTTQNPIVNNYTTMTAKHRNQPQISIQSVKGADGMQFSVNDPRANSRAYAKRINDDAGSSRHSSYSQSSNSRPPSSPHSSHSRSSGNMDRQPSNYNSSSPSSHQWQNNAYNNETTSVRAKHYGRGGLRR